MARVQVFVSAWVGSENIGDELLFSCLKRRLERLGAQVVVASKNPPETERLHRVEAVHHYDALSLAKALYRSQAMIFGGGGLIQDATSALSLPYHLSRVLLARAERVPFIGLGLGVGPLRHRTSPWLLRNAFNHHRGLTVRDQHSAQLLRQCGITNIQVTSDMVFSMDPPREQPRDQIVLALRSYKDGLIPERYRLRPGDPTIEVTLARALDETARRTQMHLRFLAFEGKRDEEFNRRVAARMTTRDFSFASVGINTVMQEIGAARLVIAMRYHGGVTAVVAEKPVVLIGYAPKVTALADELGDDCRYIAHEAEALSELPHLVDTLLGKPVANLSAARLRLQALERGNSDLLQSFITGAGAGP